MKRVCRLTGQDNRNDSSGLKNLTYRHFLRNQDRRQSDNAPEPDLPPPRAPHVVWVQRNTSRKWIFHNTADDALSTVTPQQSGVLHARIRPGFCSSANGSRRRIPRERSLAFLSPRSCQRPAIPTVSTAGQDRLFALADANPGERLSTERATISDRKPRPASEIHEARP